MNLRERILNFEHWISSGFKLEAPNIFQKELLKLFSENTEACSFYRNWLYTLLLDSREQNELKEFCYLLNLKDGTLQHSLLLQHYLENGFSEVFSNKRINTFEIAIQNPNSNLNHNHCFLYQQYYEIEVIFLVLASFIKLNESNLIETDFCNFKDRKGNLKKGVIVDYLKSKLKAYPAVEKLFDSAYSSKVRNTIGHNNYKIEGEKIISLDGSIIVDKADVFSAIQSMQNINNYLLNYLSNKEIKTNGFSNAGVLGIAFGLDEEQPVLCVHQLSCFYNFAEFRWADKIRFKVNGIQLETSFGSQNPMVGQIPTELNDNWFPSLQGKDLLRVYLLPIEPRNGEENFITLDVGEFVVIDEGKEFDIKFEVNL